MSATATWRDVLSGSARWAVHCGDCRAVMAEMPERSVDHIVADPPYSAHTHSGMVGTIGSGSFADGSKVVLVRDCGFPHLSPTLRSAIAREACRLATGWIALFSDWEGITWWRIALEAAGGSYRRAVPWIRWSSPQFSGQAPPTGSEAVVVAKPIARGRKWLNGSRTHYDAKCLRASNKIGDHGTEKPEALIGQILTDFAVAGDLVLDCTCGSGTTGAVALRLGMRFVGIELNPHWADLSRARLTAEEHGSTLRAAQAGQTTLF